MTNAVWIPNKDGSERPSSLNLNSILFVDYLFVAVMLQQALENAIKYETLISSYQKSIKSCDKVIQNCDKRIKEYSDYIQNSSETKSELFKLRQEFLATQVGKDVGDVPKTPREVSLRELFVTKQYKFIFLRSNELLPDELEKDSIYLKADLKGNALFCTLKTDAEKIVQKHMVMGKLWYISNGSEKERFRGDLNTLSADNLSVFHISVLENLAKEGLILNPYQTRLELYQQRVKEYEKLINKAQLKLKKEMGRKEENIRTKEESQVQLTLVQQELALIKQQSEAISSNQTTTSAEAYYQLETVQPCFFDSSDSRDSRKSSIKKQDYQLEVVEPKFERSREAFMEESSKYPSFRK